ncbi:MAG: hypothetical protein ABSB59_39835, partial [Streptosporangiaceae bacterium]
AGRRGWDGLTPEAVRGRVAELVREHVAGPARRARVPRPAPASPATPPGTGMRPQPASANSGASPGG